ncbi:MAG: hypothetical protein Q8J64_01840 [Thermodesulfovibrionales bacterium]|nr:hypothetical protein [Thermodesulfovibrionales bacterium]
MEVVVALAILGIGIAALIELYSLSLRSTKRSSDYSAAIVHARSYLDEAYSLPELSEGSETFDLARGFRVTRDISVRTEKEKAEGLKVYEIAVTVTWPPSGEFKLKGLRVFYEYK